MTESLRHACARHPENALRLLRAEPGLQGSYRWYLFGGVANDLPAAARMLSQYYIQHCPWCGVDLEAWRQLAHAPTSLQALALQWVTKREPDWRLDARRAIYSTPDAAWIVFSVDPNTTRTEELLCTTDQPVAVHLCARSEAVGVNVESILVVPQNPGVQGEEHVIAGPVALELFHPNLEDETEIDLAAGDRLFVQLRNTTSRLLLVQLGIARR